MATFLLLHGGSHQAWHWRFVRSLLEERGHDVVTPTLPMFDTTKGAGDWADVAVEALGSAAHDSDLYVVAHSYSGLALPLVAARTSARRMVFVCAQVPTPGVSFNAYAADKPHAILAPAERFKWDEQGRLYLDFEVAHEVFFPDADEALARESWHQLLPSSLHVLDEPCPLTKWPDVPANYVLGKTDAVIGPQWGREASLAMLGAPAIELEGDHSPFLNRPRELVDVLLGLVAADRQEASAVSQVGSQPIGPPTSQSS